MGSDYGLADEDQDNLVEEGGGSRVGGERLGEDIKGGAGR